MQLRGLPAAPGVAIAPVWRYRRGAATATPLPDIRAAAKQAAAELGDLARVVRAQGRTDEAAIFDAQALMAIDPTLVDAAEALARSAGAHDPNAMAVAVETAARSVAEPLAALADPVIAARAADVRDVGSRIARIIAGRVVAIPERPSIAIADDLPPSTTVELPPGSLLGIALEGGSPLSHTAILARGMGIPAVVAVQGLVAAADAAEAGAGARPASAGGPRTLMAALDGEAGLLLLEPSADEAAVLEAQREARHRRTAAARELRGRPGRTADGVAVPLLANIGRPEDAARAIEAGAEGVGLFRTEFLFLGRPEAPTEDEQVRAYSAVLAAFGPDRPVMIRLADIGGDKGIPFLRLAAEDNPFLGLRGFRTCYDDPALVRTQIRAIARAGAASGTQPHLMAPMITTQDDVTLLREIVADALAGLDAEGVARAARLMVGIMVEVPSAALCAAELAADVDFFSIGSNDLTQYILAMDRTNPRLAAAVDALHPAVLRAIRATVDGADGRGVPVALCGELAGDPLGAAVLVGLGVDELSMDPGSLDAVRLMLSQVTSEALAGLARRALAARSAAEVRAAAAIVVGDAPAAVAGGA